MTTKPIIKQEQIRQASGLLDKARNIVITCHMTPDGDAIGSSLGLARVLNAAGFRASVVTPDTPPHALDFLPGICDVYIASRFADGGRAILSAADLVFCLDYNGLKRIDRLAPALEASKAPRIMIDHHLDPENMADVMISHPEASSTSFLVYHFLKQLGLDNLMDADAATCIYTGMLTDTGHFSYNSNDPEIYLVIADLLRKGLDKDDVFTKAWNTNSVNRLRICGYAQCHNMTLLPHHRMALITLSRDELDEFGYVKGDTEGLVNRPLSIPGIVYSIYLREDEKNYVKVSTRSTGDFPVNKICEERFGGGGHLNAAGGEFDGSLTEAIDAVLAALPDYDRYLPDEEAVESCPQKTVE